VARNSLKTDAGEGVENNNGGRANSLVVLRRVGGALIILSRELYYYLIPITLISPISCYLDFSPLHHTLNKITQKIDQKHRTPSKKENKWNVKSVPTSMFFIFHLYSKKSQPQRAIEISKIVIFM